MTGRRHVIVHPADTVATLLDNETATATLDDGRPCALGVPFGHKVALCAMKPMDSVVKYGVQIGTATRRIESGDHVHVHNCH